MGDILCNIFGNFGNVIKVVFTEKKPDGALIELDHPHSAGRALRSMNKQKLSGQEIKVGRAKLDRASIKADDKKSKDFRQEKAKWRYPSSKKDNKFRKIWSRGGLLLKRSRNQRGLLMKQRRQQALGSLLQKLSWHLPKRRLVPWEHYMIHGLQSGILGRRKLINSRTPVAYLCRS